MSGGFARHKCWQYPRESVANKDGNVGVAAAHFIRFFAASHVQLAAVLPPIKHISKQMTKAVKLCRGILLHSRKQQHHVISAVDFNETQRSEGAGQLYGRHLGLPYNRIALSKFAI